MSETRTELVSDTRIFTRADGSQILLSLYFEGRDLIDVDVAERSDSDEIWGIPLEANPR
jgi:hypothetical protein